MGRIGRFDRPVTVRTLIARVKKALGVSKVLVAAPSSRRDSKVSIAACCAGSCGDMVHAAARGGASFYLTGELRHHDALSAVAEGMTVVCVGHSNSERIALKALSERLVEKIRGLRTVLSKRDVDPFTVA